MSERQATGLMVGLAIAVALVQTYASPAGADDARDRAARAYEDARKAFEGGAYRAAALGFERVFQEVPNGASMLAAGRAWEKQNEPSLAADDLQIALDVGDLGPDELAKARERLDVLEADLGRVRVLGPEGTTLALAHANAVRTPATVHARPGTVTVFATLPGGNEVTRVVAVDRGGVAIVDLRPAPEAPARPAEPVAAPRPKVAPANAPVRTAAWITGGGAVAAGIAAAILAPTFNAQNNDWSASSRTDAGQRAGVVSLQIGTDTAFLGACALAMTSAVLFVVSARSSPTTAALPRVPQAPQLGLGPRWVGLVSRF